MSPFHPLWIEHQRKRFTRPDAYRLAPPGTPEAKPPGWLDPSATRVRLKEAQEEEARRQAETAQEESEGKLLQLLCEIKKLKLDHELWCFEQKYSPNQPRDELGRWTRVGGGESGASADVGDAAAETQNESDSDGVVLSDASPDPIRPGAQYAENQEQVRTAARRVSPALEAFCERQYDKDIFQCKMVGLPACYAQAALRYANCLRGLPVPPLNY